MKRLVEILLIVLIMSTFVSCSVSNNSNGDSLSGSATISVDEQTKTDANISNSGSGSVSKAQFDVSEIASKIEVKGQSYSNSFSNYLVLILSNNSGVNCDLSVNVDFYDANSKIVGTNSDSVEAFATGTSVALYFICEDDFQKYEYKITPTELGYYDCVDQNLNCEVNIATNKAIISVTNNGSEDAQFVQYLALFYNGETLIDSEWGYTVDDDSEIKAGATEKQEAHCYDDFDSVTVYLHGRSEFKLN